jgi:hypothetical protein
MTAAAAYAALSDLHEQAERCRSLWASVLHRIILDASRRDAAGDDARAWLTRPDPLALELAGLEPEPARLRLRQIAAEAKPRTPTLRIEP